jgi:uncharacterized protein YbcI
MSVDTPVPSDPMSVDTPVPTMSNEVRAACKRLWGRGPVWAEVLDAGEDTILVLLKGILTDADHSLLSVDRNGLVASRRAALLEVMEPDIRDILARNLSRETDAFITGINVEQDMASIVVTLR